MELPGREFMWRICVSYCALKTITRPFKLPSRNCEYLVLNIGKNRHRLSIDIYLRYLKLLFHKPYRYKLTFFGVNQKLNNKSLGGKNSANFFGEMMGIIKAELQEDYNWRIITDTGYEVIMDNIMIFHSF